MKQAASIHANNVQNVARYPASNVSSDGLMSWSDPRVTATETTCVMHSPTEVPS